MKGVIWVKEKNIRDVLKRIIVKIIRLLILLLNLIVPKDKRLFVFMSLPDYADNPRALFTFISNELTNKRLIWIVKNKASAIDLAKKGYIVRSYKSLRGLWCFLRACCIITSHNQLLGLNSKRQLFVALWHGMPLKKM